MSDGYDYEDDDDRSGTDVVKTLRKQNREFEKQNKEMREQLQALQKEQRGSTVKSVLEAKGVNPKVARLVPSDIEASEEAIGKWLDEFGDVLGATASKQQKQDDSDPDDETPDTETSTPVIDNEQLAALLRIQGSDSGAGAVSTDAETQAFAALASIGQNAKSSDDFFNALNALKR